MANNLPIEYPFYCPKCGHKEIITMSMKGYVGEGHMCPECGEKGNEKLNLWFVEALIKLEVFIEVSIKKLCCYSSTNKDHWRNGECNRLVTIGFGFESRMIHLGYH